MAESDQEPAPPVDAAPTLEDALLIESEPVASQAASPASSAPLQKPRRKRQWGKWPSRVVLALLFLLSFFLSVVPEGRALARGAILLPGLLTATEPGALRLAGESITHTQTTITSQTGLVYIDVYAPAGAPPPIPGKREALVMIPGIGDNRTDQQLINLSESLARVGLVVVNMTTPDLINFDLLPADEDAVIQSFNFAARLPHVDPRSIGIVGFSGGSVLACLAAADARIRDQVAFITLFGTLYNANQVMRDFGLRYVIADGEKIPFHPYADPIEVMANLVAGTLPPVEGQLLAQGLTPGGTPLPDPDNELTTPGAAAAYHLIAGDESDPAQVERNLAALSPAVRQLLNELSPSSVVTEIHCPVYLLHDHNDPSIPFTESRAFDAELTSLGHPHEYAEFGIFHHTEISSGFGLGPLLTDGSKLYRILIGVLSASS
jgi:acetyl esterase/lipase